MLVHGFRLLNNEDEERSLETIETALKRRGHDVSKFAYQSKQKTVHEHADDLAEFMVQAFNLGSPAATESREAAGCMGIVTHSFGGVVVRAALNSQRWTRAASQMNWSEGNEMRCVMIAPPNRGSSLARVLQPAPPDTGLASYLYSTALGYIAKSVLGDKAGMELASLDQEQFEQRFGLVPPYCSLMVVAGDIGHANPFLTTPNDGVVTVDETLLSCPHWRLLLTAPHNYIGSHPAAVRASLAFLSREKVPGAFMSPLAGPHRK